MASTAILPAGRSLSNDPPRWQHFEPREGLSLCDCVETINARHYALSSCAACNGAGIVRPTPILSAYELALSARADFERTADAMRTDLLAEGWAPLPNTRPERWRSPERTRVLPLADAWARACRDAEDARRAPPVAPPAFTRVDRSGDFDQRVPDNDCEGGAPVHGVNLTPGAAARKVTAQ